MEPLQHLAKPFQLPLAERLIGFIGHGEMRQHPFQFDTRQIQEFIQERRKLLPRNTQSSHAGINFDMNPGWPLGGAGQPAEEPGVIKAIHHQPQILTDTFLHVGWFNPKKHQNRQINAVITQFHGLPEFAHSQEFHPGVCQLPRHRHHPMTVGIGFDHSQYLGCTAQPCPSLEIVVPQPSQINVHPTQRHPRTPPLAKAQPLPSIRLPILLVPPTDQQSCFLCKRPEIW